MTAKPPFTTALIRKSSGKLDAFSMEKLRRSLQQSGATTEMLSRLCLELEAVLYDGITTKELYKKAFALLKKYKDPAAGKYKIKQAIMELGPTGYPFEKFIGELFKAQHYDVKTGQILKGQCVSHEVDVMATSTKHIHLAECKYHSLPGNSSDVKVALYVHSRINDLRQALSSHHNENRAIEGWVITNTSFTADAETYAKCAGLHILSWTQPAKGNLRELIELYSLYPITCLTSLSKQEKQWLLDRHFVMCKSIAGKTHLLDEMGLRGNRKQQTLKEIAFLSSHSNSHHG
ncbi:MAG TPA: restriction endonuclease [Luteibaculaceae bacterium]|nr:restriction endonuclease [Luteibaculaceae bacterium]